MGHDGVQTKEDEKAMILTENPHDPLLGKAESDPVGEMLGTGYMKFRSPLLIEGLAKWSNDRLDLLAIISVQRRHGAFREFISQAKQRFKTICVWEDWNPVVGPALERYGFTRETEIQGWGEAVNGWRWDRPV